MSARTLQRRLKDEGATFAGAVATTRFAEARRLLREPDRKVIDVALDLGYSDPAHFTARLRTLGGCHATRVPTPVPRSRRRSLRCFHRRGACAREPRMTRTLLACALAVFATACSAGRTAIPTPGGPDPRYLYQLLDARKLGAQELATIEQKVPAVSAWVANVGSPRLHHPAGSARHPARVLCPLDAGALQSRVERPVDLEPAHAAAQRLAERPAVGHPGRYASGIGSRPRLLENRGSRRHVPDLLRTAWDGRRPELQHRVQAGALSG